MNIWKFPIDVGENLIDLPGYCPEILSVIEQATGLVLYALVDPASTVNCSYAVWVCGTGWDSCPISAKFIGTVPMRNGLVWHVFAKEYAVKE